MRVWLRRETELVLIDRASLLWYPISVCHRKDLEEGMGESSILKLEKNAILGTTHVPPKYQATDFS